MNKYILLLLFLFSTNGFINENIVTKNKNIKKIYYKNDEFKNINNEKNNIKQIKKATIASGYIKYVKEFIKDTFLHPKDCFLVMKILYFMYPRKQKICPICKDRPKNITYCEECKL